LNGHYSRWPFFFCTCRRSSSMVGGGSGVVLRRDHPSSYVTDYCPAPRPFADAWMDHSHLSAKQSSAYSFRMDSPQQLERLSIRYPLNLPVSLTLAHQELHARSENVSLGGILLASAFPIPEGSTVDVAIGIAQLPQAGAQLRARGKVLRVQPRAAGDFAVAIAFDRPFEFNFQGQISGSAHQGEEARFLQRGNRPATRPGLNLASTWHMET
jgi:hypothetical protein